MLRAAVAILVIVLIVLFVRWRSRRIGQDRLSKPSKFGLAVTFLALALWVPTTTTIVFGAPSLITIALMLVAGLFLAIILFLLLGPIGIAGRFGATGAGLVQYLTLFGLHTLISAVLGGLVRVATVGLVPSIVIWITALVGFVFLTIGTSRRSAQLLSVSDRS